MGKAPLHPANTNKSGVATSAAANEVELIRNGLMSLCAGVTRCAPCQILDGPFAADPLKIPLIHMCGGLTVSILLI